MDIEQSCRKIQHWSNLVRRIPNPWTEYQIEIGSLSTIQTNSAHDVCKGENMKYYEDVRREVVDTAEVFDKIIEIHQRTSYQNRFLEADQRMPCQPGLSVE